MLWCLFQCLTFFYFLTLLFIHIQTVSEMNYFCLPFQVKPRVLFYFPKNNFIYQISYCVINVVSGQWDGILKMVGDSLGVRRWKRKMDIELQWITLIAGRESITRLGVHGKSWWSFLGEQVEVRNILSWTRQGWPHLSVLRVSLKWKVSSHEQLLKIWERLGWKKASCSLFVTLVFI